jgi:hypothetical protein
MSWRVTLRDRLHRDRLARVEHGGLLLRRPRLDLVNELRAARLAVDDGRGVFGLWRDEGDHRGEPSRAAIADERDVVTKMDRGQHRLGDEEPDEDVFGREQRHDRRTRWDGLAGAGKDVVDGASHWRGDVALVEPPLCHGHRGARRIDRRTLRGNLLIPAKRRTRLRECRFEPVNLGFRRAVIGPKLIDVLDRNGAKAHQRFVSLEIELGPEERRLRLCEVCFGLFVLGRLAASLEIRQLRFCLGQLPRGLVDGRPVGGIVLLKQRRAGDDRDAPRDEDGGEETLLGRADLYEIGLGIALLLGRRRSAAPRPPPTGARHRGARDRKNDRWLHGLEPCATAMYRCVTTSVLWLQE